MDLFLWIIVAVLLALFVIPILPAKGIKNISAQQVKEKLKDKNTYFIDVRTPQEFRQNHIHGFKNIPLFDLPEKAKKLDRNKEVVVICQSGMRSMRACKQLKKLGFSQIYNVRGGMNAWN